MGAVKSERVYFWDNTKGILIFLVVLGHFLLPYRSVPEVKVIFDFIYLFHMPAFAFVSGHLAQLVSDQKKSILKLGIAYLIFNIPMMFYSFYYEGLPLTLLTPYYSYWFIVALVAWRLIVLALTKSYTILFAAFLISILVGFRQEIDNVLALSRIIGFFPFFYAGFMLSEHKLKDLLSQRKPKHIFYGCSFFLMAVLIGIQISTFNIVMSDLLFFPYTNPLRFIIRILIYLVTCVVLISMLLALPKMAIGPITTWGRNSLTIFVLHRYIPLIFAALFPHIHDPSVLLAASFLGSIITMFFLGSDKLNLKLNYILATLADSLANPGYKQRLTRVGVSGFLSVSIFITALLAFNPLGEKPNAIHKVLSNQQIQQLNKSVSIAFVGDLILLRDQVREAYCDQKNVYDFDDVFSYAKKYVSDADFSIGVLEGPLGGPDKLYSTSNYGDGIPLFLSFPDSFADSIKNAGINMVTLANNHLMDMGIEGVIRTRNVLDEKGILHIGAYRNQNEKNKIKIIELKGIRIAVLSYTFPSNYYSEEYFFDENPEITSVIVDRSSRYFKKALAGVRNDFERVKKETPDLIVILAHMGTQFIHETDKFQQTWNEIFIREGADIIFGCHSHAVQPIEFVSIEQNGSKKQAIIVNSPGNFVNSYVEHNGDATSIVKIFIDPDMKSVLGAGIIPMWTHAVMGGMHQALPIYDILFNPSLRDRISLYEMDRVKEVQSIVTRVMIGADLSLDQAQEIYYLLPEGYHRHPVRGIDLERVLPNNQAHGLIKKSQRILFVGDSITEGSKNGGYGWYEPIATGLSTSTILKAAWGGATSKILVEKADQISAFMADLYVIAIGTNDIRYRDDRKCAMTPEEYVQNLDQLTRSILQKRPNAKFIFVAPWPSLPGDPFSKVSNHDKQGMFSEYTKSLKSFCDQKGFLFVDPTPYLAAAIDRKPINFFLIDHIHPNAAEGLFLYSHSFFLAGGKDL